MLLSSNILMANVPAEGKFRFRKRLTQASVRTEVKKIKKKTKHKILQTQCKIIMATFLLALHPIIIISKMINDLYGQ